MEVKGNFATGFYFLWSSRIFCSPAATLAPELGDFPVPSGPLKPSPLKPLRPLPARAPPAERSDFCSAPRGFFAGFNAPHSALSTRALARSRVLCSELARGPRPLHCGSRRPLHPQLSHLQPVSRQVSPTAIVRKVSEVEGRDLGTGSVPAGVRHRTRRVLLFLPLSLLLLTRCQFELPAPSRDWED